MGRMEDITAEMAEYFCSSLCRHCCSEGLSQEELEEACGRCPVGGFIDSILDEYGHAGAGIEEPGQGRARKKLRICYLSDIPARIENARKIVWGMEAGNIASIRKDGFSTQDSVYHFINCGRPEEYAGFCADQAIIDYREPMIRIAKRMLAGSCVPERYQVIDDRSIGAYSF